MSDKILAKYDLDDFGPDTSPQIVAELFQATQDVKRQHGVPIL